MRSDLCRLFLLGIVLCLSSLSSRAEDGHDAWLRYATLSAAERAKYGGLPETIYTADTDAVSRNAAKELAQGLTAMLGRTFRVASEKPAGPAILLEDEPAKPSLPARAGPDGSFCLSLNRNGSFVIAGVGPRGVLYGAFRMLAMVGSLETLPRGAITEVPAAPIRWVNQWDNFDGSIERGYAGRSIFFDQGHVRADLTRATEYARILASVGINGVTVNNVNANPKTLDSSMLREIARIAGAMRPWGIRLSLSIPFASPQVVGGLKTSDPIDSDVASWWKNKVEEIYTLIPDFGGFVVKADAEGQPGPSMYGRTPADYANVLARALAPHHGVVLYRGFVYNHHLDWNDLKADRARAGYDNFRNLDGKFDANVIVQIKHGPIDFQVREPVSPLFAALRHTSEAIELQVTQEYTGQQRHMVFLAPMWKWVLDTDMRAENRTTPVKQIVEGRAFHASPGGFVAVVNAGMEVNWLHHPMAMANLFAFGRLAWNPNTPAASIVDQWTRLTFGNNPEVDRTVEELQLHSWHAYEQYTGPMGIGTLTDIIGYHYGPGVGSAENNGWGQWFRADRKGVGMDRTTATGTGFIGQYPPQLAAVYESLTTCPDDLLLFMHHVPYTHRLHSGETVIQHMYNAHYEGAATAATYAPRWQALQGKIDPQRFEEVLALFRYQAGHAIVWRDAVDTWFYQMSGIPDELGRVTHPPLRFEAEDMQATGYTNVSVVPAETASGGKAVECLDRQSCELTSTIRVGPGVYRVAVQYFHGNIGDASYTLALNGRVIAGWQAKDLPQIAIDDHALDGHTSTRYTSAPVKIAPGDTLTLRGTPLDGDHAAVDYIELQPSTSAK